MSYTRIAVMIFFMMLNLSLFAQVTIGSGESPKEYATLQIDGKKQGLRLSRLSNAERDALQAPSNSEKAKGLLIYNTESKNLEYFDGVTWKPLSTTSDVVNGLTKHTDGNVHLGGDLVETTTVNQAGNQLEFAVGATTGSFNVNSGQLLIDNAKTSSSGLENFSISNGDTEIVKISESAGTNMVNINVPNAELDINQGAFYVSDDVVSFDGLLTYKGGNPGDNKVLYTEESGTAVWKAIEPTTKVENFQLALTEYDSSGGPSSSGYLPSSYTNLTNTIQLTAGKWIITGMLYTYTYNKATNGSTYGNIGTIAMRLVEEAGTSTNDLYVTGQLPEYKGSSGANPPGARFYGSFSAIPMTCFIEVPKGEIKPVRIQVKSPIENTYLIRNYNWLNPGKGNVFRAMRVQE